MQRRGPTGVPLAGAVEACPELIEGGMYVVVKDFAGLLTVGRG